MTLTRWPLLLFSATAPAAGASTMQAAAVINPTRKYRKSPSRFDFQPSGASLHRAIGRPQAPTPAQKALRNLERARTETVQRAVGARRAAGVAGAAAVPEQVDVKLELLARRRDLEHRVVKLLERRARAEQGEPRP